MRYLIPVLPFIFLQAISAQAQIQIEGRVLDNVTNQPLSGASVYINHTTIGTTTQMDGSFALPGLDAGNYELVVSHVGYERILFEMKVGSNDLRLVFRMDTKVDEMREILVIGPQLRKLWLEIFRQEFLGRSVAAQETFILNEDDIFFAQSGDADLISAFSDIPLVIENRALGYRIYFELLSFNYHRKTGKSSFLGYNRFEELVEGNDESGTYSISRLNAYKGSTMHFFRSLRSNQLREEGFSMRGVQPAPERSGKKEKHSGAERGPEVFLPGATYPADRKSILGLDTASQQYYLHWKDALLVTYLPSSDIPVGLTQTGGIDQGLRGQESYIFIVKPPVYVLEDGTPADPQSVRFGGSWHAERVANMLPRNYNPRRKSILNKKRL